MRISPITPDAFCRSIEKALDNPPDVNHSIKRIQNTLNRLPEGKLIVSNQGKRVVFFTVINGKQKYLSKKSDIIHPLARRRYQTMLLEILKLTHSTRKYDHQRRKDLIVRLQQFIHTCVKGNLDITKIVLTSSQYAWFTGKFWQKSIDKTTALMTNRNIPVRSKSERDILNGCDSFAIPFHYEERMTINVKYLVDKLEKTLLRKGFINHPEELYTYIAGEIHWNVPQELQWMNAYGSVWRTYYPPKGTIEIYNDIKGMFADGSIFIWEHEGLITEFGYRCHALERAAVMKITNAIEKNHLIETYERDVDAPEKVIDIIEREILPRLWF